MLLAAVELEGNIAGKFKRVLVLTTSESSLPETAIAAADSSDINLIRKQGFIVNKIASESNYLEIRLPFTDHTLKDMAIQVLLPLKEHILWVGFPNGKLGMRIYL